jgi:FkbM family methyltransferase
MENKFLYRILDLLYKFCSLRVIKNHLRPLKHFIFGRNDIYYVIDEIKKAHKDDEYTKVIFDIGASIGDKSLTFLKEFPNSILYAFEPQQTSFSILQKRMKIHGNRIRCFNYGFYNKTKKTQIMLYSYRDASSIIPIKNYMKINGINQKGIETIEVRRLDDVCKEINISNIGLIKIDVEGVEKEVFEGGLETLKKVDNVYVEISPLRKGAHSRDYIDLFNILYEAGFTFMGVYGDYWFSRDSEILGKYFKEEK